MNGPRIRRDCLPQILSVKGASRGSGATVTLNGMELGSNGEKPIETKLTNNGAGTHPPVTCPKPPLKGGRRGEARRRSSRRLVPVDITLLFYHEAYVTSQAIPKPALAVAERD